MKEDLGKGSSQSQVKSSHGKIKGYYINNGEGGLGLVDSRKTERSEPE